MLRLIIILVTLCFSLTLFARDTILKLFQPYDESTAAGNLSLQGECLQQSRRIQREDAWRCITDGQVHDPCFINNYGAKDQAICVTNPWTDHRIVLRLNTKVESNNLIALDMSKTYPWAIEMSTGEKCSAVDEGESIDGLSVRYFCDNQKKLIGHLQRCNPQWTILESNQQGQVIQTGEIIRAWF